MKHCPRCDREYHDETLNFCLDDGAWLETAAEEQRTAILPGVQATAATRLLDGLSPSSTNSPAKSQGGHSIAGSRAGAKYLWAALALLTLIAGGFAGFRYFSSPAARQIESIAVLPFVNESGHPDVEYLSDGMAEALINTLSRLPRLTVKARSTVFSYKGRNITATQVGSELAVQAVLNGRVAQRGENLTLSLELVDVASGDLLWGEKYDRRLDDIAALQGEIARDVSDKLRLKLTGADEQKLAKSDTENAEAYRLYLKGRYQLNRRTGDGFRNAISFFQQAIEQDPDYALAYAGVADVYNQMGAWNILPPHESFPKARSAAEKALTLNDNLAEVHASLAFVKFNYEWQFAEAERGYQRAFSLNPNYAAARELYGYQIYLVNPNRFDEALRELNSARDLDPLSLFSNFGIATLYYFERNYDEAIKRLREIQSTDPNFTLGYGLLGVVYIKKSMGDEAVAAMLKGSQLEGGGLTEQQVSTLRKAHNDFGLKGFLLEHVKLLQELSRERYVSPIFIAMDYAHLGDKERAFAWLEKAYEERSSWLTEIAVDPVWDELRPDPRFHDLMRRVGVDPIGTRPASQRVQN
jgi:TolB-like protein